MGKRKKVKAAVPRCTVADRTGQCSRPQAVRDKGLCAGHYKRFQRHGDVGPAQLGAWSAIPRPNWPAGHGCAVRGCSQRVEYKQARLCRDHYHAYRRRLDAGKPVTSPEMLRPTCAAPDCKERVFYPRLRLCKRHHADYRRALRRSGLKRSA